jgi:hypothetical protein
VLKGGYYNMLALNIDSFMGGVHDIWSKASDRELNNKEQHYTSPSTSDGKLEIVCFGSSIGMAMERMFGGFATRVTQGAGPYLLSFKRYEEAEKHRTYLQIDGEFIRFTHPKSVKLSHSQLGGKGKIRVLRRNLQAE